MPDAKITSLQNLTSADPANDMLPIVDVSDNLITATGTTKRISINNILACSPSATLASATITGDLTVATDRLKVVTGSTAVQTGATTQLQVGTTSWPSTVIGKSGSRSLFGNTGEVVLWTEAAPAIGNYSTLFVTAKTGAGATTMGGLQIRAGIENASNSDGFVSLWTSNSAAGGFVERYKIDSTGVATWSNVGGVAGTAMTLNSTGLGVGVTPTALSGFGTTFRQKGVGAAGGIFTENNTGVSWFGAYSGTSLADSAALIYPSGGTLRFATTTSVGVGGFAPQMTLDASGNVGVGVTPSAWSSPYKSIELDGGNLSVYPTTDFYISQNAVNVGGWKYKATGFASQYIQVNSQHRWLIAASGTAGNSITFTQAMTLDASGNLSVGTTTPLNSVRIFAERSGGSVAGFNRTTSDGTNVLFYRSSSIVGDVSVTTTGTTFNSTSDYRLKESVAPMSGGLARVNALKPSVYKWKSNGSDGEGFLAHELAEVVPAAVNGEKDAVNEDGTIKAQSIDMSRIVPILVAAIKELTAEVNALKNA